MLEVNEKKVRAALAQAQQALQRGPAFWPRLEEVGRCLHWLSDPTAAEYFRQAASVYPVHAQPDLGYLTLGNYYRFTGEYEQSRQAYAQADALLAMRPLQDSEPVIQDRLICAFMLGQDAAVEDLARQLQGRRKAPDPRLLAFPLARVAHARRIHSRDEAATAVDEFASMIKRYRIKVSETGYITCWDGYELALQTLHQLTNDSSST